MKWIVQITRKAEKQVKQLPEGIRKKLVALILDIEVGGPVRGNWPNYRNLDYTRHHYHNRKANPVMVPFGKLLTKRRIWSR